LERPCAAKAPPHPTPPHPTPLLASTPSSTASPEAQLHRQEGSWAETHTGIHTETRTETQARTQANANRNADRNKGRYARRNAHRNAHRNRAQKSDAKIRRENPTRARHRTARTHCPNALLAPPLGRTSVAKKGQPPRRVAARNGCRTRCGPQVTARSGLTSGRCPDPSSQSAPWSRACGRGT